MRFPGQFRDAETGLNYNMMRDYDPTLGRYIEADPISLSGGLNIYEYAAQNPVWLMDPNGETEQAAVLGVGTTVFGTAILINQQNKGGQATENSGSQCTVDTAGPKEPNDDEC